MSRERLKQSDQEGKLSSMLRGAVAQINWKQYEDDFNKRLNDALWAKQQKKKQ